MKKKDKKIEEILNIIKHTRTRTSMPRPAVFDDKTKYKRSRQKTINRKIIDNE